MNWINRKKRVGLKVGQVECLTGLAVLFFSLGNVFSQTQNAKPVAYDSVVETAVGTAVNFVLEGEDPDGDSIKYRILSAPKNGYLNGAAPNLKYTPLPGFVGTDSFVFAVFDGELISNSATFFITVDEPNSLPVASNMEIGVDEDSAVTFALTASDSDGGPLRFNVTAPILGALIGEAPDLTYIPPPDYSGEDVFSYTVTDPKGGSAEANVIISVKAVNDAPTVSNARFETRPGTAVSIQLTGEDIEGDTIRFAVLTPPSNGYLNGSTPNLSYTPLPGFTGTDSFTFRANDGEQVSAAGTITIEILEEEIAAAVTLAWSPNSEPNLGGYKIYYGFESRNYTQVVDTGNVSQKRISELENDRTYFFALTAYNTLGLESDFSEEIQFTTPPLVNEIVEQLVANPDILAVMADQPTQISASDLLSNDTYTGAGEITLAGVSSGTANGGSVALVDGQIVYQPAAQFEGEDAFTYGIRAGELEAIGYVTLNVEADPSDQVPLKLSMDFDRSGLSGGGDGPQFQVPGEAGKTYTLQWTEDFAEWNDIQTVAPEASGPILLSDTTGEIADMRFYRVKVSGN